MRLIIMRLIIICLRPLLCIGLYEVVPGIQLWLLWRSTVGKLLSPFPMAVPVHGTLMHAILPSRTLKATAFIVVVWGGDNNLWAMHILLAKSHGHPNRICIVS